MTEDQIKAIAKAALVRLLHSLEKSITNKLVIYLLIFSNYRPAIRKRNEE